MLCCEVRLARDGKKRLTMVIARLGQAKRCAPWLFGKVHLLYTRITERGRDDDGDDVSGRDATVLDGTGGSSSRTGGNGGSRTGQPNGDAESPNWERERYICESTRVCMGLDRVVG